MLEDGVYSVIEGSERPGRSLRRNYCGLVPGSLTANVAKVRKGRSTKSAGPEPRLTLRSRICATSLRMQGEISGHYSREPGGPGPRQRAALAYVQRWQGWSSRQVVDCDEANSDQPLLLLTAYMEAISWYPPSQAPSPPADGSSETFASCSDSEK